MCMTICTLVHDKWKRVDIRSWNKRVWYEAMRDTEGGAEEEMNTTKQGHSEEHRVIRLYTVCMRSHTHFLQNHKQTTPTMFPLLTWDKEEEEDEDEEAESPLVYWPLPFLELKIQTQTKLTVLCCFMLYLICSYSTFSAISCSFSSWSYSEGFCSRSVVKWVVSPMQEVLFSS